jgi:hypothetical protein
VQGTKFQMTTILLQAVHDGKIMPPKMEQNAAGALTSTTTMESVMGFGRGALLWLLGVPLPIVLLLALFMHH